LPRGDRDGDLACSRLPHRMGAGKELGRDLEPGASTSELTAAEVQLLAIVGLEGAGAVGLDAHHLANEARLAFEALSAMDGERPLGRDRRRWRRLGSGCLGGRCGPPAARCRGPPRAVQARYAPGPNRSRSVLSDDRAQDTSGQSATSSSLVEAPKSAVPDTTTLRPQHVVSFGEERPAVVSDERQFTDAKAPEHSGHDGSELVGCGTSVEVTQEERGHEDRDAPVAIPHRMCVVDRLSDGRGPALLRSACRPLPPCPMGGEGNTPVTGDVRRLRCPGHRRRGPHRSAVVRAAAHARRPRPRRPGGPRPRGRGR
jgi:hypothetical protein